MMKSSGGQERKVQKTHLGELPLCICTLWDYRIGIL